ncbi:amidoligase family protein [Alicyclobacillus sp. SO9]|uniref:amidoligase family protein n=1 Tax=Alicyclobacillus sp. SO9 TaxID=2665646 RepID=UPI0018E875E4|nr:amidoligase family protein [Alicyclobacillus sp. SO9]QQE79525.1 amidoligase family protein [Alicyclobacillus sp. SO9]
MPVTCIVCNRPLRAPRSVMQQVGPVCAKRVRELGAQIQTQMRNEGTWTDSAAASFRPGQDGWLALAQQAHEGYVHTRAARRAARIRARQQAQVTPQPEPRTEIVPHVWSATQQDYGDLEYVYLSADQAECHSSSGNTYFVTENSCTCPHHDHRGAVCRHIQGFRQLQGIPAEPETVSDPVPRSMVQAEPDLSAFDSPEEAYREQQLNVWRSYSGQPTLWMSRDDQAWEALRDEASGDLSYVYEGVLGGTDNTFGLEIEFEDGDTYSIGRELYGDGLLLSPQRSGYHGRTAEGKWKFEYDASVSRGERGGELVSPVFVDSRESWAQIQRVAEVVHRHGGRVTVSTGGHVHIGMDPLDERAYRWQRLARIGLGYEKALYRMGAADDAAFQRGDAGRHRGAHYANPIPDSARRMYGTSLTADQARRLLVNHSGRGHGARYTAFNTMGYIERGIPTVEFRYPNSSLDPRSLQAQVCVTNALVHQSAILRQATDQGQLLPGLSQTREQCRVSQRVSEEQETQNFRKFLDVLGNREVQLAATWLWLRGRA